MWWPHGKHGPWITPSAQLCSNAHAGTQPALGPQHCPRRPALTNPLPHKSWPCWPSACGLSSDDARAAHVHVRGGRCARKPLCAAGGVQSTHAPGAHAIRHSSQRITPSHARTNVGSHAAAGSSLLSDCAAHCCRKVPCTTPLQSTTPASHIGTTLYRPSPGTLRSHSPGYQAHALIRVCCVAVCDPHRPPHTPLAGQRPTGKQRVQVPVKPCHTAHTDGRVIAA